MIRSNWFGVIIGIMIVLGFVSFATAGNAKVDVCHIPPGNPDNFHTVTVSERALSSHLAHGDLQGACNDRCTDLCNDNNACTMDDTGDCEQNSCPVDRNPVDCNDSNVCTGDTCDPINGCMNEPLTGNDCTVVDSNVCTAPTGVCDPNGACTPMPVPGCCLSDAECDDGNSCTTDTCNGVDGCSNLPCAAGDACNNLVDCDPSTCAPVTEPVDCDDGDLCTADSCVDDLGCVSEPFSCDDGDPTTEDSCDSQIGCINTPGISDCVVANGLLWCFNNDACGEACDDVCASKKLNSVDDNTVWFEAQNTTTKCEAISQAFGLGTNVSINSFRFACVENSPPNTLGGGLSAPLFCSTFLGCPDQHRTGMDNLGIGCGLPESWRSICPCEQ